MYKAYYVYKNALLLLIQNLFTVLSTEDSTT